MHICIEDLVKLYFSAVVTKKKKKKLLICSTKLLLVIENHDFARNCIYL